MTNLEFHMTYNNILKKISTDSSKLDIGTRQGFTGYIDFIELDELKENMFGGKDTFNRPFIVAKGVAIKKNKEEIPFFQTFFQRYWDNELLWVANNGIFSYQGGLNTYQKKVLIELFTTGKVDLVNIDYPSEELRLSDDVVSIILK